jgi:excisionase family DNA binding protein
MQDVYLNSEQAAVYLGIKERKLYDLVAAGRIPATKATGKWLFPRAALDRWLESGLFTPPGFEPKTPPLIIAGSQDPLLDWAARRSGSGLALLAEGSEAGLRHLERQEAALAAIHLHRIDGNDAPANVVAVKMSPHLFDAVLIGFADREQGLFGLRQAGAGAQLLFDKLCVEAGREKETISTAATVFTTGEDLAFAIHAGQADCGIATRAVAIKAGLQFLPLVWEAFDLAIRRRTYFEPALQAFFAFLGSDEFHAQARALGGYRTDDTGRIKLNR